MKQIIRAAGIGFGATLGAGAALVTTGALVAILARAGVRKSIDDLTVKISEIVDQAAANLAEPPDQTRPESRCTCPEGIQNDPSALHVLTCPYAMADEPRCECLPDVCQAPTGTFPPGCHFAS